jgi:c-di-GMP-binding flagellar brake protein YcgR
MASRRAHSRVRPKPGETIEVQLIGSDFLEIMEVRDISAGGLGLQVPHRFDRELAGQVDVIITLPRERSFSARGVIRHVSNGTLFGLEFTELPAQAMSRIERYVAARIAEGAGSTMTAAGGP